METFTYSVLHLGTVPFQDAWDFQEELALKISRGEVLPTLLLLEHPHTFTIGRGGSLENLVWSQAEIKLRGVELHQVDRGGDITYHGPGQLVGYPLIPLQPQSVTTQVTRVPKNNYIAYLRSLEEMLVLALRQWGISGLQVPGQTGVWVKNSAGNPAAGSPAAGSLAKIASIGIKVDARGITRHGFSLNVAPDMQYWTGIVPCGLPGTAQTSLASLLTHPPQMTTVMEAIVEAFSSTFNAVVEHANIQPNGV